MDVPSDQKKHFRHILYFAFRRGQTPPNATQDICSVYGEDVICVRTAERWFSKFRDGNFSLEDTPRSGRPTEFDEDHLEMLVKQDGKQTCRELAKTMASTPMTISRHLKSMGFTFFS